jgi:tRNA1Val (adenine37-N6)-methyltransferase
MKVNTDGVLLGAAASVNQDDRIVLDVGTGTGVIALIIAQKLYDLSLSVNREWPDDVRITGIDVDGPACEESAENFGKSPWPDILNVKKIPLSDYIPEKEIDLIVSNPPYFEKSLKAPDERRSFARHSCEGISYADLISFSKRYLSPSGRLALILPAVYETDLLRCGRMGGLFPSRIIRISTTAAKRPSRLIAEFSRSHFGMDVKTLLISEDGRYTEDYRKITEPFYL